MSAIGKHLAVLLAGVSPVPRGHISAIYSTEHQTVQRKPPIATHCQARGTGCMIRLAAGVQTSSWVDLKKSNL